MTIPWRGADFLRNDDGSELTEYALVLSLFAVASIVTVQLLASTGNARVESDETNYTNAFVVGN